MLWKNSTHCDHPERSLWADSHDCPTWTSVVMSAKRSLPWGRCGAWPRQTSSASWGKRLTSGDQSPRLAAGWSPFLSTPYCPWQYVPGLHGHVGYVGPGASAYSTGERARESGDFLNWHRVAHGRAHGYQRRVDGSAATGAGDPAAGDLHHRW